MNAQKFYAILDKIRVADQFFGNYATIDRLLAQNGLTFEQFNRYCDLYCSEYVPLIGESIEVNYSIH